MRLRRIANGVRSRSDHEFQQYAHVEAGAANAKIVSRPFACFVLAPGFAHPFAIRFKASRRQHAATRFDAFSTDACRHKTIAFKLDGIDRCIVANLHAAFFGTTVIRVDERLAATHEECVGPGEVQGARQRRLKMHAMLAHPVAAGGGGANREPRQFFISEPTGDLQQVLPVFLLRVGLDQHVLRRIVHAAQIARVRRIAAAPQTRG